MIELGVWLIYLNLNCKIKTTRSLSFVQQEGYFLVIEVHESFLLMYGMTSEVISQKYMPELSVVVIQILFQVLCDLKFVIYVLSVRPCPKPAFDRSKASSALG